MEIFLVWIFGSFFVGFVFGTARTIGFWGSFLLSLLISPLLGLIITLFSETNKQAEDRARIIKLQQEQANSLRSVTQQQFQQPQQSISTADELKKLKELLDAGALTQQEFDAQKKKLLEK